MLLQYFSEVPDHRRGQGKMYDLAHLLLFIVLGVICGCNSYRDIEVFLQEKYETLSQYYDVNRKQIPSYGTIRYVMLWVGDAALEECFRKYANRLVDQLGWDNQEGVWIDGKKIRGSYDHKEWSSAIQLVWAYLNALWLIIWHSVICDDDKTNEIPITQELLKHLSIKGKTLTFDALHFQKKPLNQ